MKVCLISAREYSTDQLVLIKDILKAELVTQHVVTGKEDILSWSYRECRESGLTMVFEAETLGFETMLPVIRLWSKINTGPLLVLDYATRTLRRCTGLKLVLEEYKETT